MSADDKVSLRAWVAVTGGLPGCFMAGMNARHQRGAAGDRRRAGSHLRGGSWISTAYLVAEISMIPPPGWWKCSPCRVMRLAGVPAQFAELRAGAEPVDADPDPGDPGLRGGADPAVDATDPHRACRPAGYPSAWRCSAFPTVGPGRRPVDRRLAGGCLFLALDLSPATCRDRPWPRWPGRSAPRRRPRTPAPGRLARHRRDGRRPRRSADSAGGRWPPRLVRVRLHPHLRRPSPCSPCCSRTAPTARGRSSTCACWAATTSACPAWRWRCSARRPSACSWCPTTCPSCRVSTPGRSATALILYGLVQLLLAPLLPRLMRWLNPKLLVAGGFAIMALGCWMGAHLNADAGRNVIIPPSSCAASASR